MLKLNLFVQIRDADGNRKKSEKLPNRILTINTTLAIVDDADSCYSLRARGWRWSKLTQQIRRRYWLCNFEYRFLRKTFYSRFDFSSICLFHESYKYRRINLFNFSPPPPPPLAEE